MIQGWGSANSKVMLIADGGGPECATTNYAMAGYTGEELGRIAGKNCDIKNSYKTLLVKERINASDPDSYKSLIPQYRPILLEEINSIKPNLIIPLNEQVFQLLTELSNIRKFRGSVVLSRPLASPTKVLPILGMNPYINQDYKQRWVSQIDFTKVPRYSETDALPEEQTKHIWIAKSANALRNFLERQFKPNGLLVFDIETYFGVPICISFCFDGVESVCIPFLDKQIDLDNRVLMVGMIARVLASPIRKVNQNIKFDWKRLARFNFSVNNVIGDTLLASNLLTPEFPKNLGFLTSIYTEIPYFKDEGKQSHLEYGKQNRDTYYLYNAKDSLATWQIHEKQEAELAEIGSKPLYDKLVPLICVYKDMEERGIRIDNEQVMALHAKYTTMYNIQLIKLQKLLSNNKFNPQSPKQVSTAIFDQLGYVKTREVKGTDEESLEWLMVFGEAKRSPIFGKYILTLILDCRKLHKVIEYLETPCYADGTWKTEYNLAGTVTGRTTAGGSDENRIKLGGGADKIFGWKETKKGRKIEQIELGRSFQTIAKHGFIIDGITYGRDLRKIFVPRRGYSFVEIDLSQAEARVDAVLSGDFDILTVFDGPVGIHKLTGSWVYDCPPEEIKKNVLWTDPKTGISTDRYHMAKTTRHAGERNMFPGRLAMMTQKPVRECDDILKKFHVKQPNIREVFHRQVKECIDLTRVLISPHGRVRQFLDRKGDRDQYNNAISQLPQCIVSDQLKISLVPTLQEVGEWAFMLNEAHDGTLAEVPHGREEEYAAEYKKNIEVPIDFRNCSLPRDFDLVIPCEVSVSRDSWFDLKEVKF